MEVEIFRPHSESMEIISGLQSMLSKRGLSLLAINLVVGEAVYKMTLPVLPHAETMGLVGAVALAVNALCFGLLWRHRGDDINMRSVWLCSRNDILANLAVLLAALAVAWTGSRWPDILIGLAVATLFLHSAYLVLVEARRTLRSGPVAVSLSLPKTRQSRR